MKICCCGWYFIENLKVLDDFKKLNEKYPIFVVSHRASVEADGMLKESGLDYWIKDNTGAEFGAYDWYLKNRWDGGSDVLFMHDDIQVDDFGEFDRIAELQCDQAYVFQTEAEEIGNGRRHGRMIFMSVRILKYLLENYCHCRQFSYDHEDRWHNKEAFLPGCGPHNGFWFDRLNHGHTEGKPPLVFKKHHEYGGLKKPIADSQQPADGDKTAEEENIPLDRRVMQSVRHYNAGIDHFDLEVGRLKSKGFDVKHRHHAPGIWLGRRNRFKYTFEDVYYRREISNAK